MQKKSESLTISLKGAKLKLHRFTQKDFAWHQKLLAALESTSRELALAADIGTILENIATILGKALGAKYVNFWDFTADRNALFIRAAYGMQKQYIEHSRKYPIPVGSAWIGRAVKTHQAWATRDITKDPRLKKEIATWRVPVRKQDYHGLLCIPMPLLTKAIGGMCIYYKDIHDFEYLEMNLATIVAYQAATAAENARIFGELISEKQRNESMVKSLYDGLVVLDLEGKITAFNPRAEELLWVKSSDLAQKAPEELDVTSNNLFLNIQQICSVQLTDFESRQITLEEPMKRTLEVTLVPLRNAENKKIGTMRVLHDVTEEKEAEQLKSQFVTIASHQLRTPLSGLKWALHMMLGGTYGSLTEGQKQLLGKSLQTNENLITLVNDLLDMSRLEEGRFTFQFEPVDLYELVKNIAKELSVNIETGKLDFHIEQPTASTTVYADKNKFRMVLANIIDNAVKYTLPGGSIKIKIIPHDVSAVIQVADTGIGIEKQDQKFIFNKFFRARNALKLQTSGSGLGLYIAKEITAHHNGRIWFESEEGKGSTFYVQIPIKQSIASMPKTPAL
ncbi:MAG: PAS domain S-box protein [Candidatus Spechtbacteria bacterium]|nr:PAS domain S-box protein [Candidatus Spechtbacteria bacterium]